MPNFVSQQLITYYSPLRDDSYDDVKPYFENQFNFHVIPFSKIIIFLKNDSEEVNRCDQVENPIRGNQFRIGNCALMCHKIAVLRNQNKNRRDRLLWAI